jgi:uncharacterized LabA/DUF88 family protein
MTKARYAILLDGGFLTKKLYQKHARVATADDVVAECDRVAASPHVSEYELLRIYYYDAPPSNLRIARPVSGTPINLASTDRFRNAQSLYDHLVLKPNFALRMGETWLSPYRWKLKSRVARELIRGPRALTDKDFDLDIGQKGVDMRVGMDMARLALREMVRAVVVVTADSDFIPVFKFVRREGVRVILEPMGHNVRIDLKAHADIVL